MKFARFLAALLFLSSALFSFSQDAPFSVELKLKNKTEAINDGQGTVITKGGKAPFVYLWSQVDIGIYTQNAEKLPEGDTIKVTVIDANSDTAYAQGLIETSSFAEHINNGVKPALAAMETVLFTNIWSDTIRVNKYNLTAPNALDAERKDYTIKEWVKADGAEVKNMDIVAILQDGDREIFLRAVGDGKLVHGTYNGNKIEAGDNVYYTNQRGHRDELKLGRIDYSYPQIFYQKNLTTITQGIPLIVVWLIFGAFFFTFKMRFPQFKGFKHAIQLVRGVYDDPEEDQGEVTHFQALTTALSATIGLGNIAGVAIAISLGGPGASFWIIIAGFLGMAMKFVECTLAVKYRERKPNGEISGGPMYYLKHGLAKRGRFFGGLGKVLAVLFCILCIGGSFGGGNMFQANNAFLQLTQIPGWGGLSEYGFYFGLGLAVLVGIVIVGGIKSIARVTDKLVPVMVVIYVVSGLVILGMNYSNLGNGFYLIIDGAFNSDAMYGGFVGVLIMGFRRAVFSNEAGVGSAPIVHSAAKTKEPVSEGTVALLEPFLDTVVVCTMTALVIIFAGYTQDTEGLKGAALTSAAFSSSLGSWAMYVLSISVLLFAFSTMISWSYYGLKAWSYLFGDRKYVDLSYKLLFLVMVVVGSSVGLGSVVEFSDLMILGMAFPNILGLLIMSGEVRKDVKIYFDKVKSGAIKRFK